MKINPDDDEDQLFTRTLFEAQVNFEDNSPPPRSDFWSITVWWAHVGCILLGEMENE